MAVVKRYLDAGGDPEKKDEEYGASPVHWAALVRTCGCLLWSWAFGGKSFLSFRGNVEGGGLGSRNSFLAEYAGVLVTPPLGLRGIEGF